MLTGGHKYNVEQRAVLFRFSKVLLNSGRLHQIVWQAAITTT